MFGLAIWQNISTLGIFLCAFLFSNLLKLSSTDNLTIVGYQNGNDGFISSAGENDYVLPIYAGEDNALYAVWLILLLGIVLLSCFSPSTTRRAQLLIFMALCIPLVPLLITNASDQPVSRPRYYGEHERPAIGTQVH
jgi:hypothetical protein